MPNSNLNGKSPVIVPYSFSLDLLNDMGYQEETVKEELQDLNLSQESVEEEKQEILKEAQRQQDMLIDMARQTATQIIEEAKQEAEEIKNIAKEEGYQSGFNLGKEEGKEIAFQKNKEELEIEASKFLQEIQRTIAELESKKEELLKDYSHELCNLALTVAEKVIKISLKSSTEVITKMILAATEKSKNKEWARIHISGYDANLMIHGEADLLNAVQHISPHVKVVIMENKQPGTCIIEFPDQIIDASVNTQLDNMKEILEDHRLDGGM